MSRTRAATPRTIVELLNRRIVEALKAPEVGPRFAADGSEPVGSSPSQFAAHIKAEIARNARLVKTAGMCAE